MGGRALSALAALLLGWLAVLAPAHAAGPQFPALTGRVVDAANVIPPDVEARLDQKLAALETQSQRQLVVATIPDLQGYDIAYYGYQLGRAWGIGAKGRNDGALLIVAPKERKLRIEVGYGLEGVLTDGLSSLIITQTITPRLKAGDIPGGIEAGVDGIVSQLSLPPEQASEVAREAIVAQDDDQEGHGVLIFTLGLFSFFVGLTWFLRWRARKRGRRYFASNSSGTVPVSVWDSSSSSSGWSSGSDSDSSSTDSFSGGGGDFGGGGSSGDW